MRRFPPSVPCRLLAPILLCAVLGGGALLGTGCSVLSSEEPPVADTTFTRILIELHLLNGQRRQAIGLPPAAADTVLVNYGVSRTEFERTLEHYSTHPKAFSSIYDAVVDTLRSIEERLPEPSSRSSSSR
ncbi:MAG: hypothetical protein BRD55_09680 [Bacteroidetes bacterium SW_9_63_38]|nr:MAG: hypothetical protein BRD55_09680 [Bacteroidetes bacterium SW_9_63_38]